MCVEHKEEVSLFLLEGAFDGRGGDFKVLVSPSVHPLVGGDAQSCDLGRTRTAEGKPTE